MNLSVLLAWDMQNTRLNTLFDNTANRLGGWLRNPWRRMSVLIISVLLGNFFGTAISTVSGQQADLDILVSAILAALTELVSRITYGSSPETRRSLPIQMLNALKIGLVYSLFVEAFKLGS
ncbi:MAG: DUF565 domain-containing protein [Leptolyngbyaceae cyanobacterium bins.302]|nr:DUF565 domain-containing protein [Leptolyngbyaceae cyanobacterium bins.302]